MTTGTIPTWMMMLLGSLESKGEDTGDPPPTQDGLCPAQVASAIEVRRMVAEPSFLHLGTKCDTMWSACQQLPTVCPWQL